MSTVTNEISDKTVVIIGGGPAGLTASYQLSKKGVKSIVLEKDDMLGGISRTVHYKDYHFDIGGHRFFTKNDAVEGIWREVLGENLLRRQRLSRIYYNNNFFAYPLRPFNALFGLGVWNSVKVMLSYLQAQLYTGREEDNFEQWVSSRFGHRLYNIFFKTYTEKVWGIPCSEIRAEWAAQRIKGLSLVSAIKNSFSLNGRHRKNKGDVIKTLIDEFDYPKYGPGMMWETVASRIGEAGSEVWLGSNVEKIHWSKDRIDAVEVIRNGEKVLVRGSDFISSMPLRDLISNFIPAVPEEVLQAARKLRYRDFLTVALIVNRDDIFPDNWIYIHDPRVKVGRVQNFKNWSPYMVPKGNTSCLGLEYFCFEGDDLWSKPDSDLMGLAKHEMEKLGFLRSEDIDDAAVVRMQKAYPIYDSIYKDALSIVRPFLDGIRNLHPVGRNGQHRYNNQDHSMLTAMMAAENVLGARHDLWQVNEEMEYHEEIKARSEEEIALERLLNRAFSRMDKLGFATAVGTVSGLMVFLATLFFAIFGSAQDDLKLYLLDQYFLGYSVSVKGAFIGLAYSFSWTFLFAWLFAYLRNLFAALYIYRLKKNVEMINFSDFIDNF